MSLESNKNLGGIGALLIAIGSFFPILSLIGIILVLVSMKGLAEYYDDEDLFKNALYGFIFGIIGIVAAIAIFFGAIFAGAFQWAIFQAEWPILTILIIILALIIMFIFLVLQALFYRKSFTLLAEKSGEKIFDTAGLLLLIGAILTIILVGFILLLVAWILVTVGFFSIKETVKPVPEVAPPTTPTAPAISPAKPEKRYCQYCGAETSSEAVFCQRCGKKTKTE